MRILHRFIGLLLPVLLTAAGRLAAEGKAAAPAGGRPAVESFLFDEKLAAEDPAVTQWRLGTVALEHRLYANAEKHFRRYRELVGGQGGDYARGTAALVQVYVFWGRHEDARKELEDLRGRGIAGLPAETEAELVYFGGYLEFLEKRWRKTLDIYQGMLNPFVMTSYTERMVLVAADCHAHLKDWAGMTRLLERYLPNLRKDTGNDFRMRFRLVRGYAAQKDYPAAQRLLQGIAGRVPQEDSQEFEIYRCLVLAGLGRYPEALQAYDRLEEKTPAGLRRPVWSSMCADLAALAAARGELDRAADLYRSAITTKDNPDVRTHLIDLAELRIRQRKPQEAIDVLQKWRRDYPGKPEYPRVTLRLGEILRETANWLQASELFAEAVGLSALPVQDRLRASVLRADSLEKGGCFNESAQAYLEVGKLTGKDKGMTARAYSRAAEVFVKAGRPESAAAVYSQVADSYGTIPEGRDARYNQALTLLGLGRCPEARKAFARFLEEQPGHPRQWEGRLKYAEAWKAAAAGDGDRKELIRYCWRIGEDCPAEALSLQGYFKAYEISEENGLLDQATGILRRVTERYPRSSQVHLAIYKGIALLFRSGKYDLALQQSELFLGRFAQTGRAADVYMLLGDYYQSLGKYEQAIGCYGKIRRPAYESALEPEARYETARCHLNLERPRDAERVLEALLPGDGAAAPYSDGFLSRVELQLGEAYAMEDRTEKARRHFALARNYAQDGELGLVALARQGEMLIQMATVNPALWDKAIECFSMILKPGLKAPPLLWERVRFQLAKCHEGKGDRKQALFQYQELYLEYLADRQAGRNRSWKYYYLSVWEMTRILEGFGDDESLRRAARLYEELGGSNLPRAAEAAARAELIRRNHALGKGA